VVLLLPGCAALSSRIADAYARGRAAAACLARAHRHVTRRLWRIAMMYDEDADCTLQIKDDATASVS